MRSPASCFLASWQERQWVCTSSFTQGGNGLDWEIGDAAGGELATTLALGEGSVDGSNSAAGFITGAISGARIGGMDCGSVGARVALLTAGDFFAPASFRDTLRPESREPAEPSKTLTITTSATAMPPPTYRVLSADLRRGDIDCPGSASTRGGDMAD